MKYAEMITKCACGSSLSFTIKKPNLTQEQVSKADCPRCRSRFLFMSKLKQCKAGRKISFRVKEILISDHLKDKLQFSKITAS